ncbi:MAG: hypothetical protein KBD31_05805 [Proteobacteria bacterium]|nr:hypothetical protein [Pseudomonadota bacterium]
MKILTGMLLASIMVSHASSDDQKNGAFASRLDSMRFSDLKRYDSDRLESLKNNLVAEKTSDPYLKGRGAYKAKVDAWLAAVNEAKAGNFSIKSDAIPERVRPMDGRKVINMFEVTESQLRDNPSAARRFYWELQDTKKSQSYKDQPRTKQQADKWINWLEDKGFGVDQQAAASTRAPEARASSDDARFLGDRARDRTADRAPARLQESEGPVVERTNDYGGKKVTFPNGAVYVLKWAYRVGGGQDAIWTPDNEIAKNEALDDRDWSGARTISATHLRVEKALSKR